MGPLIPLFWTSGLYFKVRVDSLACVLFRLRTIDFSDSSLVRLLLTPWCHYGSRVVSIHEPALTGYFPVAATPVVHLQTLVQRGRPGVIFLHVSVILSTGEVCLSACWDTTPQVQTPSRSRPPQEQNTRKSRPPLGGDPPRSRHPQGADPPSQDGYCCGRYASYWNAFLF